MKLLYTILFSFLSFAVSAQVPQPAMLWLQSYGGNSEVGSFVSPQLDGGFIIDIGATDTNHLDPLCSGRGNIVVFQKYNSDASVLEWSKCYGDTLGCMFATEDGDYVLAGTGGISYNFLIHKENTSGTILWSKTYGGGADAILISMVATNDGGYLMVGETSYTDTDFTVHYGSFMNDDIGVIKVDSNGNKVWSEVIGGTGDNEPGSVVLAPNGGCYIIGGTTSNDYDCTGNHGGSDAYVIRLDSNGNKLWHQDIGGAGEDYANFAVQDGKGGVLIAGVYGSTSGSITTGLPDYDCPVWEADVDSSGNIVWYSCFAAGGGDCWPYSICRAIDGSIWIAAIESSKGNDADTNYGVHDAWFLHTDDTGRLLNAMVLGSSLDDEGAMVYPLSNGNVMAGGYFGAGDGAFANVPFYGFTSSFLTVFEPWSAGVSNIQLPNNGASIYPNPAIDEVTIVTGQTTNESLVITDVTGRQIYKAAIKSKAQVHVSGWAPGVYYVSITDNDGYRQVRQLVIK